MAWQLDGTKKTRAQIVAMSPDERRAFYKSGCAYFRDLNNVLAVAREIRNSENEVNEAQAKADAAKAKHATLASRGGGL